MQYCFYGKSDRGKKRKKNEDFILDRAIGKEERLFIISDGMGGHRSGHIASKLASTTFADQYQQQRTDHIPVPEALQSALNKANVRVFNQSSENRLNSGMGTTLSVLVVKRNEGSIIHVGDSRIYQIRDSRITRMTQDHTLVAKLLEEGHISPQEAQKHPRKNILYQSVGIDQKIKPHRRTRFPIQSGDIYVLCSDGLSNMVDEETIRSVADTHYPKEAVLKLIRKANKNGGNDNISVQVIKFAGHESFEQTEELSRGPVPKIYLLFLMLTLLVILYFLAGFTR